MMNPQMQSEISLDPDRVPANGATRATEVETLVLDGFTQDEIVSLLWLRQWYQNGGSDRVEVLRELEALQVLVMNGNVEL